MNKIVTLMRLGIKEPTNEALESSILTKPSKYKDKQTKHPTVFPKMLYSIH